MPGGDGTGPYGKGPLTGRGIGPCGRGLAFRRGFRGFIRQRWYRDLDLSKEDKKRILEAELQYIQEEIKGLEREKQEIENKLKEL